MGMFDMIADAVIGIKKNDNHSIVVGNCDKMKVSVDKSGCSLANSFVKDDIKNSLIIGMEWRNSKGDKTIVKVTNWNTEQLKGIQIPFPEGEHMKVWLVASQSVTGAQKDVYDFFYDNFKNGKTSNNYVVSAVVSEKMISADNIKEAKKVIDGYVKKLLNIENEFDKIVNKIDNPKVVIPEKYANQVELDGHVGLKNFPSSRIIPLWNIKNIQKTEQGIEIEFKNGISAKRMKHVINQWLKNPVRDVIAEKGVPEYEVLQVSHYFCTDTVKLSNLSKGNDIVQGEKPLQTIVFPVEVNSFRNINNAYHDRFKLDVPAYSISVRHQKEFLTEFVVPKKAFPLKVIDTKRDMYMELKNAEAVRNFLEFPVNYLDRFKDIEGKQKVEVANLSVDNKPKEKQQERSI